MKKSLNDTNDVNQMMIDELNFAVESIDNKTSDALKSARKQVLNKHASAKPWYSFTNAQVTTAFASVAGVVMIVALTDQPSVNTIDRTSVTNVSATDSSVADSTEVLENLPILFAPDELDFFQSVDFLVWMEKGTG